jgi:hypothetical protein
MTLVTTARLLGLGGDIVSFAGAILLALGEAGEEERARNKADITKTVRSVKGLLNLPVEQGGVVIRGEEDIEIAVARPFSRRARTGAWIIAGGFILLFFARILEMLA